LSDQETRPPSHDWGSVPMPPPDAAAGASPPASSPGIASEPRPGAKQEPFRERAHEQAGPARSGPAAAPPAQGDRGEVNRLVAGPVEKLGIVGGTGVGKSFLFLAMVYRTYGAHAGAMSYFLEGIEIQWALQLENLASEAPAKVIKDYRSWRRLARTDYDTPEWYRLRLHSRTGIRGTVRSTMDVEFVDAAGELFEGVRKPATKQHETYADARVMVFCLPLWAAFPAEGLGREDWRRRDRFLDGFGEVLKNYRAVRAENRLNQPVKSILALTMADDRRHALTRLRDRWISPYVQAPHTYLRQLQRGSGIARYLANARRVSEALHREFTSSRDPRVSSIPRDLDLAGRPWLIPLSAIDGAALDEIEARSEDPDDRPPRDPPEPAHVELPLLVALCERDNALM
jgi:hypothetical protein